MPSAAECSAHTEVVDSSKIARIVQHNSFSTGRHSLLRIHDAHMWFCFGLCKPGCIMRVNIHVCTYCFTDIDTPMYIYICIPVHTCIQALPSYHNIPDFGHAEHASTAICNPTLLKGYCSSISHLSCPCQQVADEQIRLRKLTFCSTTRRHNPGMSINAVELPCCRIMQVILQSVTGLPVILHYCAVVPPQECFCHATAHCIAQQCIK